MKKKCFFALLCTLLAVLFMTVPFAASADEGCQHHWVFMESFDGNEIMDNQYHRTLTYITEFCDVCYEVRERIEVGGLVLHKMEGNYCPECGYYSTDSYCDHEWEITKFEEISHVDSSVHVYSTYQAKHCYLCGNTEYELIANDSTVQAHSYDDEGVCYSCGYSKVTNERVSDGSDLPTTYINGNWDPLNCESLTAVPVEVSFKPFSNLNSRHYGYSGPDKKYYGEYGYKPDKVVKATALFKENDYVLVDVQYKTTKRRVLYFRSSDINGFENVESLAQNTPVAGTVTQKARVYMGPGYGYSIFPRKDIELYEGDQITCYFEKDGWIFCEFRTSDGTPARGWVPHVCLTN